MQIILLILTLSIPPERESPAQPKAICFRSGGMGQINWFQAILNLLFMITN